MSSEFGPNIKTEEILNEANVLEVIADAASGAADTATAGVIVEKNNIDNTTAESPVKEKGGGLYAIEDKGGRFEATLPGLFSEKHEGIVGTCRQSFDTYEEAERAVDAARKDSIESREKASLKKTFPTFLRIDNHEGGRYKVTFPALKNTKTGHYVGTSYFEFNTWEEARDCYLRQFEDMESLTYNPLLEIKLSDQEQVAFSDFNAFNPQVAPSKTAHEIPASIEKYLFDKEKLTDSNGGAYTYEETIKEPNWEMKLFSFVSTYLNRGDGQETLKQLRIGRLDALTPRQAIELATQVVIDLTKYKYKDIERAAGSGRTESDNSTALQILKEGLQKRNDPEWEGNGVCRNFASSVKAVFEALKSNQTQFSKLRNTYCLYESGDREKFDPKREAWQSSVFSMRPESGHAWNTFVTVSSKGAANAVIVDATWAKRDLETKEVTGLDHTLMRMESIVYDIGRNLDEDVPDKNEQLNHILSYYLFNIEKSNGKSRPEDEQHFFATRALSLMSKHDTFNDISEPLVDGLMNIYAKLDDIDVSEIETLYRISRGHSDTSFAEILKTYLNGKEITNYQINKVIFRDDDLQRAAFEMITPKLNRDKLLQQSPAFRVRMRNVSPELFEPFSPATRPEDFAELKYIAFYKQNMLRSFEFMIRPNSPEEQIDKFFEKARQKLQEVNPRKYDEMCAQVDNYQLIKRYDAFYMKLGRP